MKNKYLNNHKVEICSNIDTDAIRYALQNDLNTKELVNFSLSLANNLTEEDVFWKLLFKEVESLKKYFKD
jgi:hypothetical protein